MYYKNSRLILLCLVVISSFKYNYIFGQTGNNHVTVILSIDGFRWDYPTKTATPSLNRIASEGVKAVSLIPSFPSKTFPNHYTIATGLVPDHHGIVNNSFHDPVSKRSFSLGSKNERFDPVFYGGEPIWITAQKQGVITASLYWPGSDVSILGWQPDIWKEYDQNDSFIQRIDTMIKWISKPPVERPRLIMAYYHEPDGAGHEFGPDDRRTLKVVHEIDSMTGILYSRIRQLPSSDSINVIVVSDHGMGSISSDLNVVLRDYIPENWPVKISGANPNYNFYAETPWSDSAYFMLKKVPGIKVWRPKEVPHHLNYGTNPRCGNLIVVADSAWSVTLTHPEDKFSGGTHGYDIHDTDVHAIFYASGPDFKKNFIAPSFQNIHIYSLLAYLLGIKPAVTDGDLQQIIDILQTYPRN